MKILIGGSPCTHWSIAVSYTHLDVYKRQLFERYVAEAA